MLLKKHYSSKEKNNYTVAIPTLDGANSEENKDINISHGANLRMNTFHLKINYSVNGSTDSNTSREARARVQNIKHNFQNVCRF